jgi:secondary thiamine-phosphate synthase enzyme
MDWQQVDVRLKPRHRGMHLVTQEVLSALPHLKSVQVGMLHLFIQHTSASLCLNENADPDVRADMERWLNHTVPDDAPYFVHTAEGPDDMPAHMKAAVLGSSLTIPIRNGRLALGTWQGIYLGEHRDSAGSRTVVATIWGQ